MLISNMAMTLNLDYKTHQPVAAKPFREIEGDFQHATVYKYDDMETGELDLYGFVITGRFNGKMIQTELTGRYDNHADAESAIVELREGSHKMPNIAYSDDDFDRTISTLEKEIARWRTVDKTKHGDFNTEIVCAEILVERLKTRLDPNVYKS